MANRDDKQLSKYKQEMLKNEPKEEWCGINHVSIAEAISHALQGLDLRPTTDYENKLAPYLGTMKGSEGNIVGFQVDGKKRFRLDYDQNHQINEATSGVKKGVRGVHVNEENFTRTVLPKRCHPTDASLLQMELLISKWSRRYNLRGFVTPADLKK